jgi:hypothetical protein
VSARDEVDPVRVLRAAVETAIGPLLGQVPGRDADQAAIAAMQVVEGLIITLAPVSGALVVLVEGDPGGPLAVVLGHLGCAVEAAATGQVDAARRYWVTARTMLFQVPGALVDNGDTDDKGRWRF